MSSQHTPGPWRVYPPGSPLDAWEVQCPQGVGLAITRARNSNDKERANAHLIAAAPEMLEAVEGLNALIASLQGICTRHLEPNGLGTRLFIAAIIAALDGPLQREVQAQAHAAIAAAKGGTA